MNEINNNVIPKLTHQMGNQSVIDAQRSSQIILLILGRLELRHSAQIPQQDIVQPHQIHNGHRPVLGSLILGAFGTTTNQHRIVFAHVRREFGARFGDHVLDAFALLGHETTDRYDVPCGRSLGSEGAGHWQVQSLPRRKNLSLANRVVQPVGSDATFRVSNGLHYDAVTLRPAQDVSHTGAVKVLNLTAVLTD